MLTPRWDDGLASSMCCIARCDKLGVKAFESRLYCTQHWYEAKGEAIEPGGDSCENCGSVPFKCCIINCNGEGIITQMGTQNHYCVKHAWKVDRPDENGLAHPTLAGWDSADAIRSHGKGLNICSDPLPAVSKRVEDECHKELEEAKKKGYRLRVIDGDMKNVHH